MSDKDLEEIRRRKMEELLRQQTDGEGAEERQDAFEAQKSALLRQIMTLEARERLARIRLTNPEVVDLVEQQLLALYQSGRLRTMVDDKTLLGILRQLMPGKRDINIERR